MKRRELNKWKQKMQEIKELSRWCKRKQRTPTTLVDGAESQAQVGEKIRHYWQEDWKEDPELANT